MLHRIQSYFISGLFESVSYRGIFPLTTMAGRLASHLMPGRLYSIIHAMAWCEVPSQQRLAHRHRFWAAGLVFFLWRSVWIA